MINNDSIWGNIRDRTDNDVWDVVGHGAPISGPSGTGTGITGPGSTYIDLDSVIRYTNIGTKAAPNWVNRETSTGSPTTPQTFKFNTGTFTAAGSGQSDATPITTLSPAIVLVLGGNGINGCRLPPAIAGNFIALTNSYDQNEGQTMKIYPTVGDKINQLPINQPVNVFSTNGFVFTCAVDKEWRSIPSIVVG